MTWLLKRKLKLFREQTGFTLLEALIAVGILAVIGTGLLAALDTNSRATRTLDEQVTAANLASAHLEVIKESPYALAYPNASDNITIPPQYTVVINTQCSSDGSSYGACTGSDNETLQKITVVISREGKPVLSLCTLRCER